MRVVARIVEVGPAAPAACGATCQHPDHGRRGHNAIATVSWLVRYDGGGGYTRGAFFSCAQHAQEMRDGHVRAAVHKDNK